MTDESKKSSIEHNHDLIERLLITGVGSKQLMRQTVVIYADHHAKQLQERIAELEAAINNLRGWHLDEGHYLVDASTYEAVLDLMEQEIVTESVKNND